MNNPELDEVLDRLRKVPVPECPARLEERVLRRVRAERMQTAEGGVWSDLAALALRPRMAVAMVTFTASLGAMTTAVASHVAAPVERRPDTLGLEMIANPHILECHHTQPRSPGVHSRHP